MAVDTQSRLNSVAVAAATEPAKRTDAFASLRGETLLRRLESRIMFDAAGLATAIDAIDVDMPHEIAATTPHDVTPGHAPAAALGVADLAGLTGHMDGPLPVQSLPDAKTIVFIDAKVPDLAVLEASIADTAEIVLLDPEKDGLDQMAAYLAGRHDLDAIHIISHGEPGKLHLGSSTYDATTLKAFDVELGKIGASLHQSGDILIYGCDVAQGATGDAFVHKFADLTHADVAGSSDRTGAARDGGNWLLEHTVGSIEAATIAAPDWNGELNTVITVAANNAAVSNIFQTQFVGPGITATGQTQIGSAEQFGTFTNDATGLGLSKIPLTSGIVMVTGQASSAATAAGNTSDHAGFGGGITTTVNGGHLSASDSDLNVLSGNAGIFDAAGFSFNFKSATDRIGFVFSFASDEYPEFVATSFNDAFGFFIQGGTDYATKTNLALVPGTHDGIAVNTVNPGVPGSFGNSAPWVSTNSNYFISNSQYSGDHTVGPYLEYDGLTKLLTVTAHVTRDTTYSMKIAIGDAGDAAWDSAVFFKPQGFLSLASATDNAYATTETHVVSGNVVSDNTGKGVDITPTSGGFTGITVSQVNGAAIGAGVITLASGAKLTMHADGSFDYDPTTNTAAQALLAGQSLTDSFTYSMVDSTGVTDTATVKVTVANPDIAPVAFNDSFNTSAGVAATIHVLGNDTDADSGDTLTVTQVAGHAIIAGGASIAVTGGTVSLDSNNDLKFTPNAGYTGAPTFNYTIDDGHGGTATAIVSGHVNALPVATADLGSGIVQSPITVDVLANDTDVGGTLNPAKVQITGTTHVGDSLVVSGEGIWSVNGSTGAITFTPATGFFGTPAPISYTVADVSGAVSNSATVSIMPIHSAPHVDLSGPSAYSGAFLYGHGSAPYGGANFNPAIFTSVGNEVAGSGVGLAYDGSSVDVSGLTSTSLTQAIAQHDYISMSFTTTSGMPETWIQNAVKRNASGTYEYAIAISTDGFQSATLLSDHNPGVDSTAPFYDTPYSNYPWAPAADYKLLPGAAYEVRAYIYNATTGTARWDDFYVFYSNDPTGHVTTFNASGAAVAIAAASVELEDSNSVNMAAGTIVLANKQTDDHFVIGGVLVSNGSTGTIGSIHYSVTETAGSISAALTGSASKADYAAFIKGVAFENTSATPAIVDRTVNVTVGDGIETSNLATTIIHVNVPPEVVVSLGDKSGFDGNAVSIVTKGAFSDANGDPLTYAAAGLPTWLSIDNTTGKISGTLPADASIGGTAHDGVYTIDVTATDPNGLSVTESFSFNAHNVAPTATGDNASTTEDTNVTFEVRSNDHDGGLDADTLSVAQIDGHAILVGGAAVQVADGEVTLGADGKLTFHPALDFTGTTTFGYTITDGQGGNATAIVAVTVSAVNDAPTGASATVTTTEDKPYVLVTSDFGFADPHDPLANLLQAVKITTLPGTGTLTDNGVAVGPGQFISLADIAVGKLVWTPATNANGAALASLTFQVQDDGGTANGGVNADPAPKTLTFDVSPANDLPNIASDDNALLADATAPAVGNVTSNDSDIDAGNDVHVNEVANNSGQPVAVTSAGTVIAGEYGVLTIHQDGSYSYALDTTLAAVKALKDGQPLAETFTYTGIDVMVANGVGTPQGGSGTTSLIITITGVNDAPVAVDDVASISEDGPQVNGSVNAGPGIDTDPEGDLLSVESAVQGTTAIAIDHPFATAGGGVLTLHANGSYLFNPGTAYNGLAQGTSATETISYTINDGHGLTSTAKLVITINGANDTPVVIDPANPVNSPGDPAYDPANPVAASDPLTVIPDVTQTDGQPLTPISAGAFIVDPDDEPLTFALAHNAPAWIHIDTATGEITGTPPADASQGSNTGNPGEYLITISATDPAGDVVSTTVTLSFTNLPPVAVADTGSASEDGPAISGNVLGNDYDGAPDSDVLMVAAINGDVGSIGAPVAGSTGGTFTVAADGTWTFDPGHAFDNLAAGQVRDTVITYRVADGQGGTAQATVTVTMHGANDAPVALGPIAPQAVVDHAPITPIDTTVAFANPGNLLLLYSATNLPAGLGLDPATGLITGTPAHDASLQGPYVVMVTVAGPAGETSTTAFEITVANPAPVAVADLATTPVDTPVIIVPLANDMDADHDALTVTGVTAPANGAATLNPDGSIAYVPNAGFSGTETITYTLSDSQGGTATASIVITVGTPPADAPVLSGMPASQSGTDGVPITPIDIGALVNDPNGQPLSFAASGLPSGLSIDPVTGLISGTPAPDASVHGPYSIVVTAIDPDGNQVTTTLLLAVANPAPVAANDATATAIDTPVTIAPLANDANADHDRLLVSYVSAPANGSVTINADGTLTYTPNAGFTGSDSFNYTASDGQGGTSIATVRVAVGTPLPDAPVNGGSPDIAHGTDGAPIIPIDIGAHISDANGDALVFSATGLPPGLVIDPATGVITGTLPAGASSDGPFTVLITAVDPAGNQVVTALIITTTNPAPIASNDIAGTALNQPVVIGVLANDLDPDHDDLSVTATTTPAHGTVLINPNGTITFTPQAGFTGTDTFNYTVTDANGASVTATVTINIGTPGPLSATPAMAPIIGNDGVAITPVATTSAFGDADQNSLLTLSVDAAALPPGIVFVNGTFSGTPANNASQGATAGQPTGTYVVPVTATDSAGATATTYVTFTFTNLPPVAVPDMPTLPEDGPLLMGNVLTNDHDTAPDSDPLVVTGATQGANAIALGTPFTVAGGGVLTLKADGSYSFDPGRAYNWLPVGQNAIETVSYTISDGNGGTVTVDLVIAIKGVNDVPVIIDPATGVPITAGQPVTTTQHGTDGQPVQAIATAGFFKDPDQGDTISYAVSGLPTGLSFNTATGLISGTLDKHASVGGPFLVKITATDHHGGSSVASLVWDVSNPVPVAVGETARTTAGVVLHGTVAGNDIDPDNDGISYRLQTSPVHGTVVLHADGTYAYDAASQYSGPDSFTYAVVDADGGVSFATCRIVVDPATNIAQQHGGEARHDHGLVAKQALPAPSDGASQSEYVHAVASEQSDDAPLTGASEHIRLVIEGRTNQLDQQYGAGAKDAPLRWHLGVGRDGGQSDSAVFEPLGDAPFWQGLNPFDFADLPARGADIGNPNGAHEVAGGHAEGELAVTFSERMAAVRGRFDREALRLMADLDDAA